MDTYKNRRDLTGPLRENLSGLPEIVAAHKLGEPVGIYSLCSAHPTVLEAGMQQALHDGSPLLVESTCNQVNQAGGYTGMTPATFRDYVAGLSDRSGLPRERLILGGDHLGPTPWRHQPAEQAMAQARTLVGDCVRAGYVKIHLDASVRLADDPTGRPLDRSVSARRTAELCLVAEEAYRAAGSDQPPPWYVIGAEVPPPGGAQEGKGEVTVTAVEDARDTIERTREAFRRQGLAAAWERVVAVVVQPGVEFGTGFVADYRREAATQLSRFIEGYERLILEVHSTDYQTRDALRTLVEDHFAILKVGPALTFAFREAVFALAMIEAEWLSGREGVGLSCLRQALEWAMVDNPVHWQGYYAGSEPDLHWSRRYSFSDRCRYYWPDPAVQAALARLLRNLERHPPPLALVSQFLPVQYERIRAGALDNSPQALIYDKIRSVLADYAYACRCTGRQPWEGDR